MYGGEGGRRARALLLPDIMMSIPSEGGAHRWARISEKLKPPVKVRSNWTSHTERTVTNVFSNPALKH